MTGGDLTPGDPLGGGEPQRDPSAAPPSRGPERDRSAPPPRAPERDPSAAPPPRPAPPAAREAPPSSAYGAGRVPPGAFAPRERAEVEDPFAGAEPAEWWRRAVATLIDAVVVGLVAAVVLAVALAPLNVDDTGGVVGAILVGLVAILGISIGALLYAPLLMARTNGKTLGRMATGIRVVRADGRRVDFVWAAYREVLVKTIALGVAGAITGGIAYLVDVLWPFFDGRKRALHDIVVDSRVVRD